ncbi:unnamed protein product [Darwinula stevensoni]|uniref:SSD domain-containing protein n=1 Tax=Darwinula stevensoni TaxID=69355 RepID=A0A7R9ABS1_9CRUS|nr:unnamed protein product [Darwinula stevensoni]CAG0899620.1 unnamed protein product [Darwinula stevensoni]
MVVPREEAKVALGRQRSRHQILIQRCLEMKNLQFLRRVSLRVHGVVGDLFFKLGCLLARRPWTFILASVILSSCLISGIVHWREEEGGTMHAWFAPETPIYQTHQWINKNFPNGVRYETIILSGPDVLTPEYFKYMGTLDKKIRSLVSNGYAWEDVCARPEEFLEGHKKEERRRRDTEDQSLFYAEDRRLDPVHAENLETTKENETTTTPTTVTTTARISQAEVDREGDSKELLQYDDYNYGWKEDSDALEVFGGEEDERNLYDDRCIYSSTLQLWAEDFDFSTITTAEIQDKVTRALDDESRNDVKGMLSEVERDESGRVVGAAAVMFVYILKDQANATNRKGQPVDLIAEPWEEKFLELVFHNDLLKPPGLKTYANAERSFRDGIREMRDRNMIYFALGFILITIYVTLNMGKFNLLEQRVYLGLAVVLCIGLTIVSAAGLCLSIGYIPTEIHNLMPFLILGIGIDDSLVIIQVTRYDLHVTRYNLRASESRLLRGFRPLVLLECLENVASKGRTLNPEERVGEALRQAGVSITITSITDVFAFAIGATTRVPVLRSFCIYTTAGIFIVYVMTLTFMVPILSLDERRRDSGREGCLCIRLPADYKKNSCSQKRLLEAIFRRIFGPLLVKTPVKVVVVLLTMSLLGLNCWGLSGLKNDFDRTWFLNPGYQRDFVSAVQDLFPESGYRADFYLEDYPKTEAAFEDKLSTFLVFTNKGRKFIRDLKYTGNLLTDFNLTASRGRYQHIYFNTGDEKRQGLREVEEVMHGVQFKGRDPFRGIFTFEYRVIRSNEASRFHSLRAHLRGSSETFSPRPHLMEMLNGTLAVLYCDLHVTPKVVSEELLRNLSLTLVGVFGVTLVLIGDLQVSIWVFSCILFTLIGIAGSMRFAGLTIELMASVLLILSVGLAVDYSTHIAHKFLVTPGDSKDDRVRITLAEIGPPVFNGGFTTMMAFVFCLWSENYLFQITLKVIWFSVIYGLYHGLVYLPVMLSWFGPQPFVESLDSTKNSPAQSGLDPGLGEAPEKPDAGKTNASSLKRKLFWKNSRGEYPIGNHSRQMAKGETAKKKSSSVSPSRNETESCAGTYRLRSPIIS